MLMSAYLIKREFELHSWGNFFDKLIVGIKVANVRFCKPWTCSNFAFFYISTSHFYSVNLKMLKVTLVC